MAGGLGGSVVCEGRAAHRHRGPAVVTRRTFLRDLWRQAGSAPATVFPTTHPRTPPRRAVGVFPYGVLISDTTAQAGR